MIADGVYQGYLEAQVAAKVWEMRGSPKRPWRHDTARRAPTMDWAAAITGALGATRARLAVEEPPADSPLAQYAGMDPGEAFAAARAEAIQAQLDRQRSH